MPGAADGDVGEPRRHVRPKVSRHDHGDLDTGAGPEAVADAPGRAVGVVGQERGPALLDVGQVDAGVGAHEAVLRLADDEVAAAAQDAHRLALDERLVAAAGRRDRSATSLPSALDTIFWVTTTTSPSRSAVSGAGVRRRVGDDARRGRRPARSRGDAVDAEDLEAAHRVIACERRTASSTRWASAAAVGRAGHDRGGHDAAHALGLDRGGERGVGLVDDERGRRAARRGGPRRRPTTRGRARSSIRSAGPLSAAPATMGDTATTSVAAGLDRVAHAGHGEHGADRHDAGWTGR